MKPERWQQIERLFQSVLECAPGQRAAFLDQACAGDGELRRELEPLLAYEERAENFIETPDVLMAGQKIKNPARMAAMLAPGKWEG